MSDIQDRRSFLGKLFGVVSVVIAAPLVGSTIASTPAPVLAGSKLRSMAQATRQHITDTRNRTKGLQAKGPNPSIMRRESPEAQAIIAKYRARFNSHITADQIRAQHSAWKQQHANIKSRFGR